MQFAHLLLSLTKRSFAMRKSAILVITLSLLAISCQAQAYVVDGSLSDWGVSLSGASALVKGYLDTNKPTGATADVVTEDNASTTTGWLNIGPGWSSGNTYDAEAMYFDNDGANLYIAIVTGVAANEAIYPAGDIFIDLGYYQDPSSATYNAKKYGFGIDIATSKLYAVNSWVNPIYSQHSIASPWKIGANRSYIGDVSFAYSAAQNSHYVLEAMISLDDLGLSANPGDPEQDLWLHWTMKCGNDYLNLQATVNPVPEPASFLLMAGGLLLGAAKKRFLN